MLGAGGMGCDLPLRILLLSSSCSCSTVRGPTGRFRPAELWQLGSVLLWSFTWCWPHRVQSPDFGSRELSQAVVPWMTRIWQPNTIETAISIQTCWSLDPICLSQYDVQVSEVSTVAMLKSQNSELSQYQNAQISKVSIVPITMLKSQIGGLALNHQK